MILPESGPIIEYSCPACGYRAEVGEGTGFVIKTELRHCRTTHDLVDVIVSTHCRPGHTPLESPPIGICPDCGGSDGVEPTRLGLGRTVTCPRWGSETRASDIGRWD